MKETGVRTSRVVVEVEWGDGGLQLVRERQQQGAGRLQWVRERQQHGAGRLQWVRERQQHDFSRHRLNDAESVANSL